MFCSFFDNQQKFVKEGDVSKKMLGVTNLFKLQNPGKVVVLAKSAIFAHCKSSSVRALDEWHGTIATWICLRSKDAQKQLAWTS